MEKLYLMQIASALTGAATANVGGSLPVDPELKDNAVRAKNLHVWETFRVFYHGLVGAFKDTTSWPSVDIPAGKLLPNLIGSLTPLITRLAGDPDVISVLQNLVGKIPNVNVAPGTPLPNPGQVRGEGT